jgi:serine/threonine protein kinase
VPRTLKHDIRTRGALPVAECVQIALSLTRALAHLHKHSLVHRDVKPSNVIFVNGVAKLADIGLVTSVDATRSFVGTEGYLPPEGAGTTSADCYSLGKLLYELSTGHDRTAWPQPPADLVTRPDRERLLELNAILHRACAPIRASATPMPPQCSPSSTTSMKGSRSGAHIRSNVAGVWCEMERDG